MPDGPIQLPCLNASFCSGDFRLECRFQVPVHELPAPEKLLKP
jgi:hypothetical protein